MSGNCADLARDLSLFVLCCASCHEEFDHGISERMEVLLTDGRDYLVCCAKANDCCSSGAVDEVGFDLVGRKLAGQSESEAK